MTKGDIIMNGRWGLISFLCLLFLAISLHSTDSTTSYMVDLEHNSVYVIADLEYHDPIVISSDNDFNLQGWPGDGSEGNPYLIDGLEIHTTDTSIRIEDVRVHFKINGCLLTGSGLHSGKGIYLENTTNGIVDSSRTDFKQMGVWIKDSANCTVSRCVFENGDYGVIVQYSENITIHDNAMGGIRSYGIDFYFVDNSKVTENMINGGGESGIYLYESDNCYVGTNLVSNSGFGAYEEELYPTGFGINLGNCFNDTVHDNIIHDVRDVGIWVASAPNSTITNNTVWGCGRYDVGSGSKDCNFFYNEFEKGMRLDSISVTQWQLNMIGNTVDGKPLGYFRNELGIVINMTEYGQIILVSCADVTLLDGNFTNCAVALQMGDCTNCTVTEFNVSDSYCGVSFHQSIDCKMLNASITNITLFGADLENADFTSFAHNWFKNCTYGIRIFNSDSCNITSNNFLDNHKAGAYIHGSTSSIIHYNNFTHDGLIVLIGWVHSVVGNEVNGKPLGYFWGLSSVTIEDQEFGQLIVGESDDIVIKNCTVDGSVVGIQFGDCTNCTLIESYVANSKQKGVWVFFSSDTKLVSNNITDCQDIGVSLQESDFTEIIGNRILRNEYAGIDGWASYNCTFNENEIAYGNSRGITLDYILDCNFTKNTIHSNLNDGVLIDRPARCIFDRNNVSSNGFNGIDVEESVDCIYTDNVFEDNDYYAIQIRRSSVNNILYNNIFFDPCDDDGSSNYWDNQLDTGNAWWDYSGTGTYSIAGSANSVDHYPRIADLVHPTMVSLDDITVEYGTTNNTIEWLPYDQNPGVYMLFLDSVLIDSNPWTIGGIIVDIDGLSLGVYNYSIRIFDSSNNSIDDTVIVTVVDTTAPTISSSSQLTYIVDTSGHILIWNVSDSFPGFYEMRLNESIIKSGLLNETFETITLNVDGNAIGWYNYSLTATDIFVNQATTWILVHVVEFTPPPVVNSPDNVVLLYGERGTIAWITFDDNPHSYIITKNGVVADSGSWTYGSWEFIVDLDGLALGVHNFTIILEDTEGQISIDSVNVVVLQPVEIDSPNDILYIQGLTGNFIIWNLEQGTPSIFRIYRNGTQIIESAWTGESYSLNVDNLAQGKYNYTIIIYGTAGDFDLDVVWVTVANSSTSTETTATTDTSTSTTVASPTLVPEELVALTIIITFGSISVVVLIIIRMYRSRSATSWARKFEVNG